MAGDDLIQARCRRARGGSESLSRVPVRVVTLIIPRRHPSLSPESIVKLKKTGHTQMTPGPGWLASCELQAASWTCEEEDQEVDHHSHLYIVVVVVFLGTSR